MVNGVAEKARSRLNFSARIGGGTFTDPLGIATDTVTPSNGARVSCWNVCVTPALCAAVHGSALPSGPA